MHRNSENEAFQKLNTKGSENILRNNNKKEC